MQCCKSSCLCKLDDNLWVTGQAFNLLILQCFLLQFSVDVRKVTRCLFLVVIKAVPGYQFAEESGFIIFLQWLFPGTGGWHGLINYVDTKAKCHLENLPVRGYCGRCLSEFKDWITEIQSVMFLPSLWFNSPPPFPVSKGFIYRQCVTGREWGALSPVGDNFLQDFNTLYLTRLRTHKIARPP